MKYLTAIALIFCVPANANQPMRLNCNQDGYCVVHIKVLELLVARAAMNCGPLR